MTDQPTVDRPSEADATLATAVPVSPPTGLDQQLTAAPSAGGDWQSAPAPAGWSTQGGVAYPAAPVQPLAVASSPRKPLRWLVAAVVVVLVAVSASAAFFVLAGAGSTSTVARFAPADSIVYLEARFDLPGDQHDKAGQFLAAFPGFADPSTLDTKLGQIYDNALLSASDQKVDYTSDIKPWFGGQIAFSMSSFPKMTGGSSAALTAVHGAVLLSVTDATKASAWLAKQVNGEGTSATYGGVALTVFGAGERAAAIGVDGTVLVGGDLETVHKIIDAKGADGLAFTADYKRASAAAPKDRVGFVFIAMKQFITAELAMMPGDTATFPKDMLDQLPAWAAMTTRFESDAIVLDEVAPYPTGTTAAKDDASSVSGHLPATTVASYEVHDVGAAIKAAVDAYRKIPAYQDAVTKALASLDQVGGLDSLTSWLGDVDVAVTVDGKTVGGGIVISLQDAKAASDATAKFAALKNAISVSGNMTGLPPAKITSEAHGDATIWTIDLGSVKDLQGLGGGMMGSVPAEIADARVAVTYTVTDTLAILGIGGDGFVKAVLDTKAGSSLVDQAAYKRAVGTGANAGVFYLDIASIRKAVEAQLSDVDTIRYNNDVKPYLAPLSAFAVVTHNGDLVQVRMILTTVK